MDGPSLADLQAELSKAPAIAAEFEAVWPENIDIEQAFLSVCTQWRTVSVGGGGFAGFGGASLMPAHPLFIGLDYGAVRAGLDAAGIKTTPELWFGLRVMEAAAASALNKADR